MTTPSTGQSPEELFKQFEELSGNDGETQTPATDTAAAASPGQGAATDAAKATEGTPAPNGEKTEAKQESEPKPDGVATRDGKHIIPYNVLQGERERAREASERAQALEAQVAALTAQLAGKPAESAKADDVADAADAATMTDEQLAELEKDFPTVAAAIRVSQAHISKLEERLSKVTTRDEQRTAQEERTVAEQVQDAIDANPKLAHVQANDPETWELAKQYDAVLRDRPQWAGKSFADRFAKVVSLVEADIGAIEVPNEGGKQPADQAPKPQGKSAKEIAAEKLAAAAAASSPTSLSDFRGGTPPASDDREELSNMSSIQLADKFAKMTPDKVMEYLQNL
jgi:hypothetical protein